MSTKASCTELARVAAVPLLLLAVVTPGCVTGHLLDAARQIERPIAYQEASVDGDQLVVRYSAAVTDDDGRPLGRVDRRAAIALADLRRPDLTVERFPVRRLRERGALPGRPIALAGRDGGGPILEVEDGPDGRPLRLVLTNTGDGPPGAFYSAVLTERRTAAWVYPLLPLTLAVDAVSNPVLLFFAPAVIVFAD
jgi:hypothetical protein